MRWKHISKPGTIGPQGTFRHVRLGYGIRAVSTSFVSIVSGLRDEIETLDIDKNHIDSHAKLGGVSSESVEDQNPAKC